MLSFLKNQNEIEICETVILFLVILVINGFTENKNLPEKFS